MDNIALLAFVDGSALLNIAGTTTIERFVKAAFEVPSVSRENVFFIVDATNEALYDDVSAYVQSIGLSEDCVMSMSAVDVAQGLLAAISGTPGLSESNLILTTLDVCFGSSFSLRTLVQHAVIRGGDVAAYMKPIDGLPRSAHAQVSIHQARVIQVNHANPNAILAPLLFLTNSSLHALAPAFNSGATTDLGSIVSSILATGRKVWASEVDFFFPITTASGVSLADSFLSQPVAPVLVSPAFEGPAARALREVNATAKRLGIQVNDATGHLDQTDTSEERRALVSFLARLASGTYSPTSKLTNTTTLPARFDASIIKHKPRQQHPCYQTTSNVYGSKRVNEMHMPDIYAPSSQAFSNGFPDPGGSHASSMVTGTRKSKVHSALDEF